MLDIKRVLKAAPTKMRSREPLQQLWTPWGERIDHEWLSARAGNKAFNPAEEGERTLDEGRTPILGEHPRPTMVRDNCTMLNGWWDYAIASIPEDETAPKWRKTAAMLTRDEAVRAVKETAIPQTFDGKILVPFSPESALSGVHQTIYPDNLLWYRTVVHPVTLGGEETVRQIGDANRLILHFEAVDYVCACYVNGQLAGTHVGGYLPFDVDISAFIDPDDAFEIALCVYDPNDSGTQLRGKQKIEREGIWYTAQSGIWQSVWLEIVPEAYLRTLTLKGASDGKLFVRAEIGGDKPNAKLHIVVTDPADGTVVADETLPAGVRKVRAEIATAAEHLWSPADPYLYDVRAELRYGSAKPAETAGDAAVAQSQPMDVVSSYCAFRSVEIKPDTKGVARFHLNGKPLFVKGVLDQGYWPDGLMTAPDDEALTHDITAMKNAGFNMLRKHLKVEADRWYYHCDRLGMLVWQDMVSGGGAYDGWETSYKPTLWRGSWDRYEDTSPTHQRRLGAEDAAYQRQWLRECRGTVAHLRAHPSVVTWVLFNEGWGQFDALACAEEIHLLDPTRPIDAVSGWYDQGAGDFQSVHNYFRPLQVYRDRRDLAGYARLAGGRAFAISEFGGVVHAVAGHSAFAGTYGYGATDTPAEWRAEVHRTLDAAAALEGVGLSAYVYTQLSDVEEECNGILTYDRRVNKLKEDGDECGSAEM